MSTVIIVAVLALLSVFFYLVLFRSRTMLASAVRRRLQPGEDMKFGSEANFSGTSFPGVFFNHREGYVAVTNLRLILAWWVFSPVWRTVKVTPLRDVGEPDQSPLKFLTGRQALVTVNGKQMIFMPVANRLWFFSRSNVDRVSEFMRVLSDAKAAYR